MQKPPTTPNTRSSQQALKACHSPDVIPTNDNCPNDINPNDNSYCAKVALVPALLLHREPPQGEGGEPPQPGLVCLRLRPPYYVHVLANKLLNFKLKSKYTYEPRPDIITTEQIRRMLGFEKGAKTNVHSVIREAIQWGVLSPALKRNGKPWPGHYVVNWQAVEVVATLPPMNIGDRPLNSRYLHHDKRQWGEFRLANELIKEFWTFARATRDQAFVLSHSVLPADNLLAPPPTAPPFIPPSGSRLHYTLLEVAGRLVPALVLGHGNIYLVPIGVRGGAQSCFPCVSYGNGKFLCAGSLKALLSLVGSLAEPLEPFPYGGHSTRLVVDAGRRAGLVPFDSFVPATDRYEPGLSQEDSALQYSCLTRWSSALLTSKAFLPEGFRGWPALVLLPRSGTSRLVSHRPDIIRRDVLACIDAVRGYIHSAVRGLRGNALSPQSSAPYALALARSVHVEAEDPPIAIYIALKDGLMAKDGKNSYRHESAPGLIRYEDFVRLLTSRSRPVRAVSFRVIVPLAGFPYLKEVLDFGFIYIYHNPQKDQPNAVRAEFRAYEGVTEALGKEGVMKLALGTLHMLDQALASTYQVLART